MRDEGCISRTHKEERTRKECFNESSPDDGTNLAEDLHGSVGNDNSSESLPECEESNSNEPSSGKSLFKEAIRQMKLDMEENRFCYIPPSVKLKRLDYLHYVRKRDEGALTYVAHADYYILLRACARAAQVDIRIMHIGVLSLERRLAWLENRIDQCLNSKPPNISCQFCSNVDPESRSDDMPGLSNLNI